MQTTPTRLHSLLKHISRHVLLPASIAVAIGALMTLSGCETSPPKAEAPATPLTGPVRLKLASAFGSALPTLGKLPQRFSDEVYERSKRQIQFKFFEPEALAPTLEMVDAVGDGTIDAGYTSPAYTTSDRAFALFAGFPFSPTMERFWEWMEEGGGRTAMEELYRPLGVMALACGFMGTEGFGWFRKPIQTVDDLRGIRMRFFGLGAKVMQKLDVSTQLLAGADIYPALDKGIIDATEFSTPYIDQDLGFPKAAENYYFPGWHQPTHMGVLVINHRVWDRLPMERQALIRGACEDNVRHSFKTEPGKIAEGLRNLETQGAIIRETPPSIVTAARRAWDEVAKEEGRRSSKFKKIYASLEPYL